MLFWVFRVFGITAEKTASFLSHFFVPVPRLLVSVPSLPRLRSSLPRYLRPSPPIFHYSHHSLFIIYCRSIPYNRKLEVSRQSLPCVRGGVTASAVTEGLCERTRISYCSVIRSHPYSSPRRSGCKVVPFVPPIIMRSYCSTLYEHLRKRGNRKRAGNLPARLFTHLLLNRGEYHRAAGGRAADRAVEQEHVGLLTQPAFDRHGNMQHRHRVNVRRKSRVRREGRHK